MHPLYSLDGYCALVVGGSRGIGRATVEVLCELGAEVCAVARGTDELQDMLMQLREEGARVHGIQADISIPEGREVVLRELRERWEGLHAYVHSAGTNIRKATTEYSPQEYNLIQQTNTQSAFELSRMLYPLLRGAPASSIVFIGSTAGLTAIPTGAPYAMSKAAMDQLTRYLAVEWAEDGIRVNSVAPWYIRTPLVEDVLSDKTYYDRVIASTPAGRIGEPREVAATAAFLCSPAAAFITGQTLAVDGGFLAKGM